MITLFATILLVWGVLRVEALSGPPRTPFRELLAHKDLGIAWLLSIMIIVSTIRRPYRLRWMMLIWGLIVFAGSSLVMVYYFVTAYYEYLRWSGARGWPFRWF
jgi:hypothetical protein